MASGTDDLHPMFQDMLSRSDGWTDNVNESSLDYNFMTRHPTMSVMFLIFTSTAVVAGNIGNVLVSLTLLCLIDSSITTNWQSPFLIQGEYC